MRNRTVAVAVVVSLSWVALATGGCGNRDLSLSSCKTLPVVNYRSVKTVSPAYNPTVPVVLIYPDGTIIKKQGPYRLISGKITKAQIDELLRKLDDYGFFELGEVCAGKPLPGGATEILSVVILTGTNTTTVAPGAAPPNWNEIIKSVMAVPVPGGASYVPEKIRLHASIASPPEGVQVSPWPAGAPDLAAAAAEQGGMVVTGDTAAVAWTELERAYSDSAAAEPYWTHGGGVYTVYASPVFPGVKSM